MMSFPVEIGIGSARVSAHLLFETLAFFVGFRYYLFLRKRSTDLISSDNRLWIVIGATFGAFLGSRLIGALEDPQALVSSAYPLLYLFASKTIVGGLLGGLLGVEVCKWFLKEQHSSGDLFTPPLILAMMIGRIGCFLNGITEQTYGIETSLPWGMDLGDGLSRHPVALYEILFLGLLWLGLSVIRRRLPLKSGYLFQFFLIAYLIFRLCLDLIKPGLRYAGGLGTIQLLCILGLLYYVKTWYLLFISPAKLLKHE